MLCWRPIGADSPVAAARKLPCGFSLLEVTVALAITSAMAAFALPTVGTTLRTFRISGDARGLSNSIAVTKIRAASAFSQARLYVDLAGGTSHVETWQKTGVPGWVAESGLTALSTGVSYGFIVANAPPNTQVAIAQAPACRNDAGEVIGNTACIIFNSRGVPVDSAGAPIATDALYITDGTNVYAVTAAATGLTRLWKTQAAVTAVWAQQ